MGAITIDIKGMSEALKKFDKYSKAVQTEIKNEVNASALNIYSNAKKMAPVNLSTLRGSMFIDPVSTSPSQFQVTVGAKAKYAPYVEFGTGGKVSIPKGFESYASQFKTKTGGTFKEMLKALIMWVEKKGIANGKQSKSVAYMIAISILRKGMKAQPFLIPAFEQERPKLKLRIEKILKDAKS